MNHRENLTKLIAGLSAIGIVAHLQLRFGMHATPADSNVPLIVVIAVGGTPFLLSIVQQLLKGDFGSDLLGAIAIATSVGMGQYLPGSVIVLMLASGQVLETYAVRSASSVLAALAKRVPSVAHLKKADSVADIAVSDIAVGDTLVIHPHEICPADGVVLEGRGTMDESFLTGEPFQMTKTIGSGVISGAINGDSSFTFTVVRAAADSRYAKIMEVMRESEATRPSMRRLGDTLGTIYTPIALIVAILAWVLSGDPLRFLAVLVIATPCPMLIGIPVAIVGSITLCAKRSIIVKSPVVLEQVSSCRTAIFDKTGTLTYGTPTLTEQIVVPGFAPDEVLKLTAAIEQYSKHPLGHAVIEAAKKAGIKLSEANRVTEQAGKGLEGTVGERQVLVTSRKKLVAAGTPGSELIPPSGSGLECVIAIDGRFAALYRFHDAPRPDSRSFLAHLGPKHQFERIMIVSGDRESEVKYLADEVGIQNVHAQKSPGEKLVIVREETARAKTLYVGDGINDAPAMMAATVGMAIGRNSDITSEAAGVVLRDSSIQKVDEFIHISRRMRRVALQSAVGGMTLSLLGMGLAAAGRLTPVEGAIAQEIIDILAVLNALRAAFPPASLEDF